MWSPTPIAYPASWVDDSGGPPAQRANGRVIAIGGDASTPLFLVLTGDGTAQVRAASAVTLTNAAAEVRAASAVTLTNAAAEPAPPVSQPWGTGG